VWRSGARPASGGQRALNAVIRGDDERSPRAPAAPAPGGGRQAWGSSDSDQLPQLASRSPKKIVVVCDGDVVQRQTLLLYKRTSQTFEQVLDDLSAMFRAPVRNMFTVDGVQVSVDRVCQCQCQ